MDVFKTHGAFSWSELSTSDPDGAASFYGKLFGGQMKSMGAAMGDYRVASIRDAGIAGIMATPPEALAGKPAWGVYVTVDRVDETLAQAKALGAQT